MKGGSISGNSASAGGGIYTYSDDVTLSAGEIKGNTAWNMGGGVYSEGNEYLVYSTLHIENALVVGNRASKQGGGLWFCPTGDAKVYVQDGGLIARNTADEAGDDVVFTGSDGAKYKLTLADRAPGGGKVLWYRDGGLFNPDGTIAATNPDVPRFVEGGNNGEPLSFTDATPNVALKSVMSDEVYNLGSGQTSLTITGNDESRTEVASVPTAASSSASPRTSAFLLRKFGRIPKSPILKKSQSILRMAKPSSTRLP